MKKNWFLYIGLILSLILNIFYFKYEIFDNYLLPKIINRISAQKISTIDQNTEILIVKKSFEKLSSKRPEMIWQEKKTFTEKFFDKSKANKTEEFKRYNYPQAFLTVGLTAYAIKSKNPEIIEKIITYFNSIINFNGESKFTIDKIDQAPYGWASLMLYNHTGETKYLRFAHTIFNFITKSIDENQMVLYYCHPTKTLRVFDNLEKVQWRGFDTSPKFTMFEVTTPKTSWSKIQILRVNR